MTTNEFLPRSNRAFVIQRCSETSDVAFRDDPPLPEGHPPENYDFGQFMTMHDDEEADIRLLIHDEKIMGFLVMGTLELTGTELEASHIWLYAIDTEIVGKSFGAFIIYHAFRLFKGADFVSAHVYHAKKASLETLKKGAEDAKRGCVAVGTIGHGDGQVLTWDDGPDSGAEAGRADNDCVQWIFPKEGLDIWDHWPDKPAVDDEEEDEQEGEEAAAASKPKTRGRKPRREARENAKELKKNAAAKAAAGGAGIKRKK